MSVKGGQGGQRPVAGNTLEWFTSSPPPPNNFDVIPRMRSVEPMKDIRREVAAAAGRPRRSRSRRAAQPLMQRLVLATGIATFVLIIVGGVVRVSDSASAAGRRAPASTAGRSATATSCRAWTWTRSSSTPTASSRGS